MRLLSTKLPVLLLGLLLPIAAFSQDRTVAPTGARSVTATKRGVVIPENTSVLGARIGYTNIEKIDGGTMSIGASYEYAVAPNLLLGASLDYWREDYNVALDRTADVSDLILGGQAKLLFSQFNLPVRPFGLIGLTAHRLRIRESRVLTPEAGRVVVDPRADETSDTEGQIGVDLGAGIAYGINRDVDITAEVRWRNILEDAVAYDQMAVSGGVSYLL